MFLANNVWWSWSKCFGMDPCVMDAFWLVEIIHTRGCRKKEPGLFLHGLYMEVSRLNAAIFPFISASLKAILCFSVEAEISETNSSTFCKK